MLAFTAGSVVVYRVGTGAAALNNAATSVFLDEYDASGNLLSTTAMPTSVSGDNQILTASGSASSEGLLSRSADGNFLVVPGYNATPGTASVAGTTSAAVGRTVGLVSSTQMIDTTTSLSDAASGNNIRGATSTDGTDVFVVGGAGGVRYAPVGSTTSTQLSTTQANLRAVQVFDGQLYVSTQSGSAFKVGTVGTNVPTTSGQTISNLPSLSTSINPAGFFMADLSEDVEGIDTLYTAESGGTISKFSLVAGAWVASGTLTATGISGITGIVSGSEVTLFVSSSSTLSKVTDASGYNASITGTLTSIASSGANMAFRGVALSANGAPTIDLNGADPGTDFATTFTPGGGAISIIDNLAATVDDPNDVNFVGARVTILNLLDGVDESLDADTTGTSITASYNSSTGVLTLSGSDTLANYQQVLRSVTYNNDAAMPTATTRNLTFVVTDGEKSDSATVTVSFDVDNVAPAIDLNGTEAGTGFSASFTEGSGEVVLSDPGLTITDPDSNDLESATVTITNLLDGPAEALAADTTSTSLTATYNSTTGVLSITGTATKAVYEQVLRTVTYNNTSENPSTTDRNVNFVVFDGIDASMPATTIVSITAVNTAPSINAPATLSTLVDRSVTFSTPLGTAISIADPDAGINSVSLTITAINGTLTVDNVSGLSMYTLDDTLAGINAMLAQVVFTPNAGYSGSAGFTIEVNDLGNSGTGGAQLSDSTVTIDVQEAPPLLLLNELKLNPPGTDNPWEYVEILGTPGATIPFGTYFLSVEGDGNPAGTVKVVIDLGGQVIGANGLLIIKGTDGHTFAGNTTELVDPRFDAGNLLEHDSNSYLLVFTSYDLFESFDYDADNDGVLEGVLDSANTSIFDAVAITDGGANDRTYGGVLVQQNMGTPDALVRLLGRTEANDVTAWYGGDLTGTNESIDFDLTRTSLNFPVGGQLTPGELNVPENTAPVVDLNGAATGTSFLATFSIGGSPVAISDPTATITDAENPVLLGATATITNLFDAGDEILSANTSGTAITADFNASTGVLTLSGSDTLANYQQVLRSITYQNTAASPDLTDRSLDVIVSDGIDSSLAAVSTISFTSENAAPSITAPLETLQTLVNRPIAFNPALATSITVADPDAGSNTVSITLTPVNGTLTVDGTPNLTTYSIEDTLDNINTLLETLLFTPNNGYTGTASLTIAVNDLGNTGSGGAQVDEEIISINVQALPATFVLNELKVNPPGADNPYEYVEIRGTPGAVIPFGTYFLSIEGDGGAAGTVDLIVSLGGITIGSNGLVVIGATSGFGHELPAGTTLFEDARFDTGNTLEHDSNSYQLVFSTYGISEGIDYDPSNTGTLEGILSADFTLTIDSVAITDGGMSDRTYGGVLLVQNMGTPDAMTRFPGNTTPLSVAAWYAGDLTGDNDSLAYDVTRTTANFPTGGVLTPGASNVPVNTPPVVDLNGPLAGTGRMVQFVTGGPAVNLAAANATLVDGQDPFLVSMTVTLTNPLNGADETLAANTDGTAITADFNAATYVLTLTGSDTVANYQQVLRSLTYLNSAADPTKTTRSIQIVAQDPHSTSTASVASVMFDLFEMDGTTLRINGTPNADVISFIMTSTTAFSVNVNGLSQTFLTDDFDTVELDADTGSDTIYVVNNFGSAEEFTFVPGGLTMVGSTVTLTVTNAEVMVVYGDANDSETFTGSDGDDVYYGFSTASIMNGGGSITTTVGILNSVVLDSAGFDAAVFIDSAGDDEFIANPSQSTLTGTGYSREVNGFDQVYAFSTGGNDSATLNGTADNEVAYGLNAFSILAGTGFFYEAITFANVTIAGNGGDGDLAVLYGSVEADNITASSTEVVLAGATYSVTLQEFKIVYGLGSGSGADIDPPDSVTFNDSEGNDVLIASATVATFFSDGAILQFFNFRQVTAISTSGIDVVDEGTIDYLLTLEGDWISI